MWIVYGLTLAMSAVLLAVTVRLKVEEDWKPEGMYRIFLRPAIAIDKWVSRWSEHGIRKTDHAKAGDRQKKDTVRYRFVSEEMQLLYPADPLKQQERCRIEKISMVLFFCMTGASVALLLTLSGQMDRQVTEDGRIERNSFGEGSRQLNLTANVGDRQEELQIEIAEKKFTREELGQMIPELRQIMEKSLKGENNSLDQVNSDLNFMTEVPGYPFSVSWESGNYGRVHSDGSVDCEGVPENGELVELKAILSCYEQTWEEVFWVRICEAEEDELQNQLQNAVEKAAADAEYEDSFYLPDRTGEMQIIWQEKVDDYSPVIFLIFILMGVMQWVLPDQEVRKKLEERDWQLRLTYPEFISKLVLLLGAGLPVRAVIVRMASDYQKKKEAGTFNYAYEELLLTCRELNSGVAEVQAYEHFGQRCRLPQYRKCMTLLTANLKKGSSGLLDTLRAEAKDAFQERKHLAREEGEKAGTRLLLPMMMTLTVVMVLILVPACFSFSGM